MAESYKSVDRRLKIEARGYKRQPLAIPGLRPTDFRRAFGKPLAQSFARVRAQIEHDRGVLHNWPKAGCLPTVLRGFVVSTQALYDASRKLLVVEAVMPPAILVRTMLEGLGNLLLLTQDPDERLPGLLRDCYRSEASTVKYLRNVRGSQNRYQLESERHLGEFADALGLTALESQDPPHRFQWPQPGELLGRRRGKPAPPLLRDDRLAVFTALYEPWYGQLSAFAHHKLPALQAAVFSEEQPDEERFVRTWNEIVTLTTLVPFCVLSEVQAHLRLPDFPPFQAAWIELRALHDMAKAAFDARYSTLLRVPPEVGTQPAPGTPRE